MVAWNRRQHSLDHLQLEHLFEWIHIHRRTPRPTLLTLVSIRRLQTMVPILLLLHLHPNLRQVTVLTVSKYLRLYVTPDTFCSIGKTRTRDKYRVVYSDVQRLELEKEFMYAKYITIRRKSELASMLQLSERQVKIWFQNRRAKERKLNKKKEESNGKQQQHHHQQQQMMHMKSEPSSVMMINAGVDDVVVGSSDHTNLVTHVHHHSHNNHHSDCPLTPSIDSNVTGSSGSSSVSSGSDSGIGINNTMSPYSYHHHHHPSVMYMSPVAVAAAAAAHNNYLSSYHYDNWSKKTLSCSQ